MPTGIYKRNPCSKETKKRISKANKGKKRTKEFCERISKLLKGKVPKSAWKKGRIPWNKDRKGLQIAWNKGLKRYNAREKCHLWQGGKSFEPYGLEFNFDLKEVIRNRDRRKCQICEKTELENKVRLSVHHIDYDKKNNDPKNLIALCCKCHAETNFNRNNWIKYFKNNFTLNDWARELQNGDATVWTPL